MCKMFVEDKFGISKLGFRNARRTLKATDKTVAITSEHAGDWRPEPNRRMRKRAQQINTDHTLYPNQKWNSLNSVFIGRKQ